MDEALLKRTTDCVYFLASPFTCKKGVECEYRHSETARLNPRDCWYWLSGNCLNPTCGFRHPPVDMHTKAVKAPAEAESLPDKSSFPPSKNNVPCYYYFNGYCNKGDKCPFLHGPEDISASKQKDSVVVDAPSVDGRTPPVSSNHIVPAELLNDKLPTKISNAKLPSRIEAVLDPPENVSAVLKRSLKTAKEEPLLRKKLADLSSILGRKGSSRSLVYEYEEAAITTSDSLYSSGNVNKSEPSICSDECSKEKVDNGAQDEWWESSSGFDVLVEGRSEGIEDADDEEEILGYDINDEDHDNLFIDRNYKDQKAYGGRFLRGKRIDVLVEGRSEGIEDADDEEEIFGYDINDEDHDNLFIDRNYKDQKAYGGRFLPEKRIDGPVSYSDEEDIIDLVGYSDGDRGTNHILSRKRKLINAGLTVGRRYDVDLRDHLAKRRCLDGRLERHAEKFSFRRCNLPFPSKERRGRPQNRISNQRLHGRFAFRLERNGYSLPMEKSAFIFPKQRRQPRCRHHDKQQRQKISSNVQRTAFSRRKRDSEVTISFTGPKTLAQIREEKCRTQADSTRRSGQSKSVNFQGPKPLTEILKEKNKVR